MTITVTTSTTMNTIKNRRDFLAMAGGRKFVTGNFILQVRRRPTDHPFAGEAPRVGFTVTKKMGNAARRNRIKRRLREAARLAGLPKAQPGHDYVVIGRAGALACDFSELARNMEFAFSKILHHKSAS